MVHAGSVDDRSSKPKYNLKKSANDKRGGDRHGSIPDANQIAFSVVQQATGEAPRVLPPEPRKNPAAVSLGRLGGLKGGKARADKLSAEQRKEIAKKAAEKRWGSRKSTEHSG
jgi:hypothetical protein